MARGSTIRRTRYALRTAILLAAVLASCLIAGTLGSRYHARWDVTATRRHTLAPRTLAALAALRRGRTIVVSADMSRLDRSSASRISDLLGEFARRSSLVRVAWIDTSSPSGRADFASLIASLAQSDSQTIEEQRRALGEIAVATGELSTGMEAVSQRMKALASAIGAESAAGQELERQAGAVRTLPGRLAPAVAAVSAAAEHRIGGALLPAVDVASDSARGPLGEITQAMRLIVEYAHKFDASPSADAARALAAEAQGRLDLAARLADALSRLKPTDPLTVARVLEAGDAVLVTGAQGTLAIDFQSLFPTALVAGAGQPGAMDQAFAGEQLIATALMALDETRSPILVFVHAEDRTILDERGSGAPSGIGRAVFGGLFERMRLARVAPAEWAIAKSPVRPDLRELNPAGDRPVVWLILAPPSLLGTDARQSANAALAERNARITAMANAVRSLAQDGENLLMCLDSSDLPAVGEPDPMLAAPALFGITADTAHPLLRRESLPAGQVTYTYQFTHRAGSDHPIGRAIDGLALAIPWASPLTLPESPGPDLRVWPILRASQNDAIWGESQWMNLRALEARGRVDALDPPALVDPPKPDEGRDLTRPPAGGWVIAAAAERTRSGSAPSGQATGPQRLLVVASPSWLHDYYTRRTESIGGRRSVRFPGNTELFEAGVHWLAGRDELIATGPQSGEVPRIAPIEPGALVALRWAVIAVPALATLILGALLRVLRG